MSRYFVYFQEAQKASSDQMQWNKKEAFQKLTQISKVETTIDPWSDKKWAYFLWKLA